VLPSDLRGAIGRWGEAVRTYMAAVHLGKLWRATPTRYLIALFAFLVSFLLREALDSWLTAISDRGFIVFLPGILLTTYFVGWGPATLTLILSGVSAWYYFLPPHRSFQLDFDKAIVLTVFFIGSAIGIALVHWLRTTIARAEALTRQQAKYLRMLDSGFDGIIVRDAQARITGWNRGAENLYGWTHDEAIGQITHLLFQTKFPKPLDEILADTLRDGHWEGELTHKRKDGGTIVVFSRWTVERDEEGQQMSILETNMDITERKRAEEVERILVREIQHRSNNLLAVIQAIANRSFSGNYSLADAKATFEARLRALARTNQQLAESNWTGVDLKQIVRSELRPFSERAIVEGVNVSLDPQQAHNFSLALHELATNAAKYGALSNGNGKVGISWAITSQSEIAALKFQWREKGGPPVAAPTRRGFGTELLKAAFPNARVDYATEGLSCELNVKLGHSDEPGRAEAR
jgi:PAS domain S-box-containing protein